MARHKIVVEWGDILMRRILDVGGLVHLVRHKNSLKIGKIAP
jgi:hypothetical protein